MKMVNEDYIEKIKYKAIIATNIDSIMIKTKKMKAIAYYDWKNNLIIINENIINNLSEECIVYIIVHEIVHKITNTKSHGSKFLNKLLSIYSIDDIIRCEKEIIKKLTK